MTNSIPRDWRIHGVSSQAQLLAGVLPRGELHRLAGKPGNDRDIIVADIAVAAASDSVTCGLSAPDRNGARASLSGWFGHPVGKACGVAIITGKGREEALDRAVTANALASASLRRLTSPRRVGSSSK